MIILSLGSNLNSKHGNRFENLELAINLLESYGILLNKKSSFYETPSYPDKKNPKFINLIISVITNLPPIDLISVIFFIEEKIGRKRGKKNDPRTCDIDIIDYNQEIHNFKYKNEQVTIPHNKLSLRNFVLIPLREILPDWKHPKTKEFIETLVKKLSEEDVKSILKVKKS